jgi:DivIVA domain-containing protein
VSLVLLLVILAVIAGIAVVAAGRGEGLGAPDPERSPRGSLPAGDVDRADVDALRFTLSLRGYRMDEVDDVIDRLLDELDRRDARIAELEAPATVDDDATADDATREHAHDAPHDDTHDDRRDADQDA